MVHIHGPRRSFIIFMIIFCIVVIVIISKYFHNDLSSKLFRHDRLTIEGSSPSSSEVCPYSSTITEKRLIFNDSSYFVHHYPEFICSQNFRNMADWILGWPNNIFDEQVENSDLLNDIIVPKLPNGSIFYIKTDSVPTFFSKIYPRLQNTFVLITGQSDYSVPGKYVDYLDKPDSKIIHWFGQNGNIPASRSQRFTHIPIGKNIT